VNALKFAGKTKMAEKLIGVQQTVVHVIKPGSLRQAISHGAAILECP
jgi:hypothetical protein